MTKLFKEKKYFFIYFFRSLLISGILDGKQLAIDNNCKYVETSCTISHNVHLLLAGIAASINPSISKSNKNGKLFLLKLI